MSQVQSIEEFLQQLRESGAMVDENGEIVSNCAPLLTESEDLLEDKPKLIAYADTCKVGVSNGARNIVKDSATVHTVPVSPNTKASALVLAAQKVQELLNKWFFPNSRNTFTEEQRKKITSTTKKIVDAPDAKLKVTTIADFLSKEDVREMLLTSKASVAQMVCSLQGKMSIKSGNTAVAHTYDIKEMMYEALEEVPREKIPPQLQEFMEEMDEMKARDVHNQRPKHDLQGNNKKRS